jgi:hypothetical protein
MLYGFCLKMLLVVLESERCGPEYFTVGASCFAVMWWPADSSTFNGKFATRVCAEHGAGRTATLKDPRLMKEMGKTLKKYAEPHVTFFMIGLDKTSPSLPFWSVHQQRGRV